MTVSHVAEMRFENMSDRMAFALQQRLNEVFREFGVTEVELVIHPVTEIVQWAPTVPADSNKPSSKQIGFCERLIGDLRRLLHNEVDAPILEQGRLLISAINEGLKDPELDKRRMSHFINTLQEAIADLTLKQKGIHTNEWS